MSWLVLGMNQMITPAKIRRVIRALAEALGPVGMGGVLQQFNTGSGDYTRERGRWLDGITRDAAIKEIERRRRGMDEDM